jgi:fatty acid desaturase
VAVGSVRSTLVWSAALYLLLGAALAGWLPWWLMAGAVPLLYARLALALHETMHRHPSPEVGLWLRLCILLESPLVLGYREHRALHLRHHRFNGGPGDPDRPLIATAPPRALLCALLVPERAFFEWVRDRGLDARLALGCAVRAVLFLAVVAIDRVTPWAIKGRNASKAGRLTAAPSPRRKPRRFDGRNCAFIGGSLPHPVVDSSGIEPA